MKAVKPTVSRSREHHGARQFVKVMLGLSTLSVGLFSLGVARGDGWTDWYLIWNLVLAWLPLVFAGLLARQLQYKEWSSWAGIGLTLAWLLFLPNSFYIVSDLIHLHDIPRENILFDSLTFTAFVLSGLILGYASLFLVRHLMLVRGLARRQTDIFAAGMLLLCSFAIYLGRDLRWNSWDVIINPAGILFDISERIIDPFDYPDTFMTTMVFFIFLTGLYFVFSSLHDAIIALHQQRRDS